MVEQLTLDPVLLNQKPEIPKNILIVDLETTGLDSDSDQVIEVAAALFNVEHREVFQSLCFLLPCEGPNTAQRINHIDPRLTRIEAPWQKSMEMLVGMIGSADVMMAHNASFDSKWFGKGQLPEISIPWLCTMVDFDWGCRGAGGLRDLAANHGVPILKAHRALADVELVAGVLAAREDLDELMELSVTPKIDVAAVVSYERRGEAKERGFRWNSLQKRWEKKMTRQAYLDSEFPFLVKIIGN